MVSEISNSSAYAYPIKTIVILVQENRSFDHMLGWFKRLNPEINGVTGSESNPISTSDPSSSRVLFKDNAEYVDPDPGHSIQAIYEQVFGRPWSSNDPDPPQEATMDGFVQNAEGTQKGMAEAVMRGFRPEAVPVYKELALEFAICDRWFSAVPASTQPNRLFVHSATAHGATSNDTTKLIQEGQKFVKEVYEALRASPQWNEMLLVITYDEHGGFYDHVPTPTTGVPSPDDIVGPDPYYFKFDRLGVRVPTFFISPWIEPGTVIHGPSGPYPTSEYEHSSIPATVKTIFNLKEFLTKRDAWAGTFECVLTRKTPRTDCPVTLPEPRKMRHTEAKETAKLSEFQQELVQMAAVLNGDYKKKIYPHKLVDNMTVAEAVKYVDSAYKKFCDQCQKAKEKGKHESEIVELGQLPDKSKSKSFLHKMFSCIVCDN
ncbi:Phosphoesterase [Corchorus olitorius]|uniref:Phosphoesterase n=1 Tax=Corchorus olitorius TaxID=93759 RepID=A0A1R3KF78_9ROSI|nr:Phosphoesterase [Corchorus olitorius]